MATQAKRDYYEVLGVGRSATTQEVEQAHCKLVNEIRQAGGETAIDRLLEANRARAILTDSIRRKEYDQFGHTGNNHLSNYSAGFDPVALPADDARFAPDPNGLRELGRNVADWIAVFLDVLS